MVNPISLAKFLYWSYQPKCSLPIILHDSLKCNISRKKLRDQVDFLFVEKHSFLQGGTIAYGGRSVTSHAQSTKNNKSAISL